MNAPLPTSATPPTDPNQPGDESVRVEKLDSGLTLLTRHMPHAPVVAFQFWVHTGGFDELDGERGLAHLHEHMIFKGTPTRQVGQIAADIEAAGGQINAWTSTDQTCYHIVMPQNAWREGLDVLADAVSHPLFDADELSREIEVVVEEIQRADDSPSRVGYRRLFERVFADHPYALPVLGTKESVRGMTSERMRAFYDKHYIAPNITLVATGAVDHEEIKAAASELCADLGTQPAQDKPDATHTYPPAAAHVEQTAFSESRLLLAFPCPALGHEDVAALDVLAIALGQGESSRLYQAVKRDTQLVNDIGAWCYTPQRGGMFTASLMTSRDRLGRAWTAMLDELAKVRAEGIAEDELVKARNIIIAGATYKLETAQGMAHSLGYYQVACADPLWEQRYHAAVQAVDRHKIVEVAQRWLDIAHAQVVMLVGKEEADADANAGAEVDNAASIDAVATLLDHTHTVPTADALMAELRDRLGTAREAPFVHRGTEVGGIVEIALSTGDVLLAMPDKSVPIIGLRVAALDGVRSETLQTNGRTHMLGELLTKGTPTRTSQAIAEQTDRLAADVWGFSGRNTLGAGAASLSRDGDVILDLLTECLFESDVPDSELALQKQVQLEDIRHQTDNPARQCFRQLRGRLFAGHPYGWDVLGSEATVRGLQRDDLVGHLRGRIAPGNLVWSAAGDFDVERLAARIEARSPREASPLPAPEPRELAPIDGPVLVRESIDKAQAHVAIGFRGVTFEDPDRHALQMLSTILSGQGGRLFLELRDRLSLAYTVTSQTSEGIEPGAFAFYIGTSPDKVPTALSALAAEIDKVVQEEVGADELDRARRYVAGALAIGRQRSGTRASALCFNKLYGLGREAYHGHLQALEAVTAADILRAAQRVLRMEERVEVVLTPEG